MRKEKKTNLLETLSEIQPEFYCLLIAVGLQFMLMTLAGYSFYFLENYLIIPCMLFLGISLTRKYSRSAQWQLALSLILCAWFAITQTVHYAQDLKVRPVGMFFTVYLLAFPFAAITRDGGKQLGLRIAGAAYLAASLLLSGCSVLLLLDLLPSFFQKFVFLDGARLTLMWQANIGACILMIGIAFSLYFFSIAQKKWAKALLLAACALQFALQALTNSRTSILLTCCLIGGFVFCAIWKGGWKRFLIGGFAAVAAILILFFSASDLFDLHTELLIQKYTSQIASAQEESVPASEPSASAGYHVMNLSAAQTPPVIVNGQTGEVTLITSSGQGTWANDWKTFNGRTRIWEAALQGLREDPAVFLWGTDYSGELIFQNSGINAAHAHNAWLEVLVCLGFPGLILVLIFTGIAIWKILTLFLNPTIALHQKTISLLLACLLGASILEPYIFFADFYCYFADFIFFLCLGYTAQWKSVRK